MYNDGQVNIRFFGGYMFASQDLRDEKINPVFIQKMAYLAEIKEWDNRPHLERIRKISYLIFRETDCPQREIETYSIACELHDVGKSLMSDDLIMNKAKYSRLEWGRISEHTVDGAKLLSGTNLLIFKLAESVALTHHERWNGSGYPSRLKGDEIPLIGRVCGLVDVFDALTTRRIYKDPVEPGEAFELIFVSKGTLFDPDIVDIFLKRKNEVLKIIKETPG
jgi:putative two-component system response regulator